MILLLGASARAAAPEPGTGPSVESRLDLLLADILGAGRARAFVRPVPLPPDVEEPPAAPDEPAALWDRINDRLAKAPPVLPGFPAPKSLREEALREIVARADGARRQEQGRPPAASALAVTLVVDDAVSDAELKAASDAVARALGLAVERGDTLRAAKAPLAPDFDKSLKDPALRAAAAAGGSAGALALLGLLAVSAAILARPASRVLVSPAPPSAAAPPQPVFIERPEAPALVPEDLPALGVDGAAACASLLQDGPDAAAEWLLRRATPAEAAAVFVRLPMPVRLGAARRLADAAGGPPPEDSAGLARRAALRAGGLDRLEQILLRAGPKARAEAVADLRLAAPAAAGALAALPSFPELAAADREDLSLCLSPFSCARLAAALAAEPDAVRAAFLDALPGVAADLVRERLAARPAGGEPAQGEILARWRRLERDGRVRRLADAASRAPEAP